MKLKHFISFSIFIICLLAGYSTGNFIFQKKPTAPTMPILVQDKNTIPGKQDGIWMIVVDRLDVSKPQIRAVWLVSYITSYVKIKPLPIYPSSNPQRDDALTQAFRMTDDHKIAPQFWLYLLKEGQTVRNYIIFDDLAMAGLINFFGGVTIQGKHLSGLEVFLNIRNVQIDPEMIIERQTEIVDSLCKSIFNSPSPFDFYKLQKQIKNHTLSNLDLSKLALEWEQFIVNGNFKLCEIPVLSGKSPVSSTP